MAEQNEGTEGAGKKKEGITPKDADSIQNDVLKEVVGGVDDGSANWLEGSGFARWSSG